MKTCQLPFSPVSCCWRRAAAACPGSPSRASPSPWGWRHFSRRSRSPRVWRSTQYLGRLAGFALCGVALAAACAAPLLLWASAGTVALWALSLACETALVAAAALFFSMTLAQLVPAIAATAGLYVLARSMAAIQSIAGGPLAEASLPHQVARWAVDAIALLLPRLEAVTRTGWLLYGPPDAGAYAAALAGLMLYSGLLIAAGLFEIGRASCRERV